MNNNEVTIDKLKVYLHFFMVKPFEIKGSPSIMLLPAWKEVNGKQPAYAIPLEERKELGSPWLLNDFMIKIIKPNIGGINNLCLTYVKEKLGNENRDQYFEWNNFQILLDEATKREIPIIPISGATVTIINKPVYSFHRFIPDLGSSVVFFVANSYEDLSEKCISATEQCFFRMAHEIGHALIHFYFTPSVTEEKSDDYRLFNEKMAWHAALDLINELRIKIDQDKFNLQSNRSVERYRKHYSEKLSNWNYNDNF